MLALDSGDLVTPVQGRPCKDPTFGLDALWIPKASQNDAIAAGYTVVDPATVVATHLNNSIIAASSELFGIDDAQALIDHLKGHYPQLAANLCPQGYRSEEHTSELQSLMRISYAVFCLKKKKHKNTKPENNITTKRNTIIT